MADFTKWTRRDFGDPMGHPGNRAEAEADTNRDLQKPIQQLLCDIREESWRKGEGPLGPIAIRMITMMGRVALQQERAGNTLLLLTWAIFILTLALVVLTVALLLHDAGR